MMDMWLFSESKLRTKFDTIVWKDEVDIQIIYNSDKSTKRPLGFFVEYKIDGIEQSPIYHYN